MGLAAPGEAEEEEQGEVEGQQVVEAASAPGRCILKVEGEAEVTAFLGSFAASQDSAEQQDAAQAPAGVQLPASCHACDAAAASGFFVAVHRPVRGFIRDCVIVSQRCVSCGAAAAAVRGTGGVSAQGSRTRQVLLVRHAAAGAAEQAAGAPAGAVERQCGVTLRSARWPVLNPPAD
jgi:hypothetical protein